MNYLCCFVHNIGIIDEMVPEKLLNWIIIFKFQYNRSETASVSRKDCGTSIELPEK
jgi:hypothetical protein